MDEISSKPRRGHGRVAAWGALLFWGINAAGLPVAVAVDTPSSIAGWLGALFWESMFVLALVGMWSARRG